MPIGDGGLWQQLQDAERRAKHAEARAVDIARHRPLGAGANKEVIDTLRAEVVRLTERVEALRAEVRRREEIISDRNRTIAAQEFLQNVRCTGCSFDGVEHPEIVTEELVAEVETMARRLRQWWDNRKWRVGNHE